MRPVNRSVTSGQEEERKTEEKEDGREGNYLSTHHHRSTKDEWREVNVPILTNMPEWLERRKGAEQWTAHNYQSYYIELMNASRSNVYQYYFSQLLDKKI